MDYVNLTLENLEGEHLCCAIADKKHQKGVDGKKTWLRERIEEWHVFRKLDAKGKGFANELLALSFDGTKPKFTETAKKREIESKEFTVFYSEQCPYIPNCIEQVTEYLRAQNISFQAIPVDSLEKAKAMPCVFNNWAVFYEGKFQTVHLMNEGVLKRMFGF